MLGLVYSYYVGMFWLDSLWARILARFRAFFFFVSQHYHGKKTSPSISSVKYSSSFNQQRCMSVPFGLNMHHNTLFWDIVHIVISFDETFFRQVFIYETQHCCIAHSLLAKHHIHFDTQQYDKEYSCYITYPQLEPCHCDKCQISCVNDNSMGRLFVWVVLVDIYQFGGWIMSHSEWFWIILLLWLMFILTSMTMEELLPRHYLHTDNRFKTELFDGSEI